MRDPSPKLQLASEHLAAGRTDQARAVLQRLLQQSPHDAAANRMMGSALVARGEHRQAAFFFERAAAACPGDPDILTDLASALWRTDPSDRAERTAREALQRSPAHIPAATMLARILADQARYADSAQACRAAKRAGGRAALLDAALAHALTQLGRAEEAVDTLRDAIRSNPGDLHLAGELPLALNYDPRAEPPDVFRAHTEHGRLLEGSLPPGALPPPARPGPKDADRPLRIGILSGDLRAHSVSYFLDALLRHRDRDRFGLMCYHTGSTMDETSERIRGLSDGWKHLPTQSQLALAQTARADAIDILIELSGYFSGHSLTAMALRPAPLQATYLGYPNTTGLSAIDARIVDSLTDPPGAESLATERLVRIDPCFLCYTPPPDAPPCHRSPGRPDFDATAPVTFGSFNTTLKLNDRLIRLWARVLAAVPSSRLVLKNRALFRDDCRGDLSARLAATGIEPQRVDLVQPIQERSGHLGAYARIDIALDTVPYAGTTTTCEAMCMGVPTVTLEGRSHAGRVGVSLMSAVGLTDLIARDEDGYVRLAASLAADAPRLAELRRTLRDRMLASPLCDGAAFAARFQGALRALWRQRCAGG